MGEKTASSHREGLIALQTKKEGQVEQTCVRPLGQ